MAKRIERNKNAVCSHCGLCKNVCPVYKVLQDECFSPRAKNISIEAFMNNEIQLDWKYFFEFCNWCEACVAVCPLKLWFDVIQAREYIVEHWIISEENKTMLENIEKWRNPFWKLENGMSIPDKLYCC